MLEKIKADGIKVRKCDRNKKGELRCKFVWKGDSVFEAGVGVTKDGEIQPTGVRTLNGNEPSTEAVDKALVWMRKRATVEV